MSIVKFKRGLKANLPQDYEDGQILFATDKNELYIDHQDGEKIVRGKISSGNKIISFTPFFLTDENKLLDCIQLDNADAL